MMGRPGASEGASAEEPAAKPVERSDDQSVGRPVKPSVEWPVEPSVEDGAHTDAENVKAFALKAARRARAAVMPDRLLAALCLAVVLAMAAPWVRVSVAELIDRDVSYSVPDVLATGQVLVDRAQSFADLVEKARAVADRAAQIVERAQDAAERASDALDGRG